MTNDSLIEKITAIGEGLKYSRKSMAQCNQESQAAMEAENLAIDEFAAEIKSYLAGQANEIPDNYDLTQRIEESLAYFCDEFPKGNYSEVWSKPVSRFSGSITPDDLQAILSILYAPKLVSGNISPAALTWATTLIWLRDILDNYCPHVWREKEGANFKAVLDAAGVSYVD